MELTSFVVPCVANDHGLSCIALSSFFFLVGHYPKVLSNDQHAWLIDIELRLSLVQLMQTLIYFSLHILSSLYNIHSF
jgi:hypothetical protein